MSESDLIVAYIICGIFSLAFLYYFLRYATHSVKKTNQQQAMLELLEKLCRKQGIGEDELDAIRKQNDIK
jgi:hypothetical protein